MMNKIVILFLVFIITGCIPKPIHQMNSYDLYVKSSTIKSVFRNNKVLKVKFPIALGTLNSSRIFYKKDGITSYYLYNRWSSSLNRLIYRDILVSLQNNKKYKNVVSYSSSSKVDLYLEIEIIDFYHVVTKYNSYAKININVKFIDANNNNIIKSRTFEFKKYLESANAKSFVKGAKEALIELIENL